MDINANNPNPGNQPNINPTPIPPPSLDQSQFPSQPHTSTPSTNSQIPSTSPTLQSNPLLGKLDPIPFDAITAAHIEPAVVEVLRIEKGKLDAIINVRGPRTYENTIEAYDRLGTQLSKVWSIAYHLKAVNGNDEILDAYKAVQPKVTEFQSKISLSDGLWRAITDYAATPEAQQLTGNRKRLLEKTIEGFKKLGANLSRPDKERLADIDKELSNLSTQFATNVTKSRAAFEVIVTDKKDLAGLPATAIAAAKQSAEEKGLTNSWRFTLEGPSYGPVMTYAENDALRERLHRAAISVASSGQFDNTPIATRTIELRQEKAKLLGFANFADLQLKDRMAGSGARARAFLEDIKNTAQAAFDRERQELIDFKRSETKDPNADLQPWESAYYAEKLRQKQHQFDSEKMRPYFPVDQVVAGALNVFEHLYGIEFVKRPDLTTWHSAAKAFEVKDSDGNKLGEFYVDLHPRAGLKQGGAWQMELAGDYPDLYKGVVVGNLTPPAGKDPALLTFREVETVFHEFGHLIHRMFTDVKELGLSSVPWDFVELPSQLMENWCSERKVLDTFAYHHETGAALPDDLFQQSINAKNFLSASAIMRQLSFGLLDLKLHTEYDPAQHGNINDYARKELSPFCLAQPLPEDAFLMSFSHIFAGGYASGYYSYMWASALEADVFEHKFKGGNLFSRHAGEEYRRDVLKPGNTEDVLTLVNRYLGRKEDENVNPEAYLRREGIIP